MTKPKKDIVIKPSDDEEDTDALEAPMPTGGVRTKSGDDEEPSLTPGLLVSMSVYVNTDGTYHVNLSDSKSKNKVKSRREVLQLITESLEKHLDM